jgi:acyl carrier protein
LNRPELTAEKFIPDPFRTEPGARLYKTGDLARYLPDGSIEFLGRIDNQVKIRGFRIELGEIEATLVHHPEVRETAVLVREDSAGETRLVAYVVAIPHGSPSSTELRSFLKGKLPDYMVPAAYVVLDRFPLTLNGKLDRRALPPPESMRPEGEQTFVAPRTPEEEIIAGIWAQVLGLDRVGIHNSFFELGGHSLKATQVIARINKRVPIEVPLRSMFEGQTVAALAKLIAEQQDRQFGHEVFDRLLSEIEAMSEEEAEKLLAAKA